MPTIQYSARSARLSVHKLFASCIRRGLVSVDLIVDGDWLSATEWCKIVIKVFTAPHPCRTRLFAKTVRWRTCFVQTIHVYGDTSWRRAVFTGVAFDAGDRTRVLCTDHKVKYRGISIWVYSIHQEYYHRSWQPQGWRTPLRTLCNLCKFTVEWRAWTEIVT